MATSFDLWEAQMKWIGVGDLLWLAGALFTAGFVVYGVWLCIMGPEGDPHYVLSTSAGTAAGGKMPWRTGGEISP